MPITGKIEANIDLVAADNYYGKRVTDNDNL